MPWEVNTAVDHLKKHAHKHTTHYCARYTRQAIEAGGIILEKTRFAKNYGESLVKAGYYEFAFQPHEWQEFQPGDVVVFTEGSKEGHMQMFDGERWISDFVQPGFYPGHKYHGKERALYRHWDLIRAEKGK